VNETSNQLTVLFITRTPYTCYRKSLEEYEISKQMLDSTTLEIEQSLVSSPEERQRLEAECKREKELLHSALQKTIGKLCTSKPQYGCNSQASGVIMELPYVFSTM